jgi:hypothetical protein
VAISVKTHYDYMVGDKVPVIKEGIVRKAGFDYGKEP